MTKLTAPANGVEVRMFRQGHGDCFLLSFKKKRGTKPFHMLIDCGMKKKSNPVENQAIPEILDKIHEMTGGVLDVVVITHEHEDHVSGFPKPDEDDHPFAKNFEVNELWLAWTEDPNDDFANELRELYGDKLLALALAHHQFHNMVMHLDDTDPKEDDDERKKDRKKHADQLNLRDMLGDFLELETGESDGLQVLKGACDALGVQSQGDKGFGFDEFQTALAARKKQRIKGKTYKERLQGLRQMAKKIRYFSPGDGPIEVPGVAIKIYPFGPPRDRKDLIRLNPRSKELFHIGPFAMGEVGAGVFAAMEARATNASSQDAPFDAQHLDHNHNGGFIGPHHETDPRDYLQRSYFAAGDFNDRRRIDNDWMSDVEGMALRLNSEVNNTSLVLGIELEKSRKVLLFTGDAQAGSWRSWQHLSWGDGDDAITAKDLLARCTFYKVGHHGSHNATLNGTLESKHPNINWMALGEYAEHFVAMIPTNRVWAWGKTRPWRHPMKAIEDELFQKAKSRVMMVCRMDDGDGNPAVPVEEPDLREETGITKDDPVWAEYLGHVNYTQTHVRYWVEDKL